MSQEIAVPEGRPARLLADAVVALALPQLANCVRSYTNVRVTFDFLDESDTEDEGESQ